MGLCEILMRSVCQLYSGEADKVTEYVEDTDYA